jgi:hypothetical protein
MVRDITRRTDSSVTVSFSGRKRSLTASSYVTFPECKLDEGGGRQLWLLDAGDCYIAPQERRGGGSGDRKGGAVGGAGGDHFIKIVPLVIESAHERENVLISIRSNLAHQIIIYADHQHSMRAENLALPCKVAGQPAPQLTVFVCIRAPVEKKEKDHASKLSNLRDAGGFCAKSLWDEYNKGVSRELIVGITVDVIDSDTRESIVQQGLQMKGRIGKSLMRLSTKVLDLGHTMTLGQKLRGEFSVMNLSDYLPLRFLITAPAAVQMSRSAAERTELEGHKKGGPASTATVSFTLQSSEWGHFLELIEVKNMSASHWSRHEDTHSVIVQHWADPGILTVVHAEEGAEGASDTVHSVDLGINYVFPYYLQTLLNPSPWRAPPRPLSTCTPPLPSPTPRSQRAETQAAGEAGRERERERERERGGEAGGVGVDLSPAKLGLRSALMRERGEGEKGVEDAEKDRGGGGGGGMGLYARRM